MPTGFSLSSLEAALAGTGDWNLPSTDASREAWGGMHPRGLPQPQHSFYLLGGGSVVSLSTPRDVKVSQSLVSKGGGGVGRGRNPYTGAKRRMEPNLHLWVGHTER